MQDNSNKYYKTLELDKVLDILASETDIPDAAQIAKCLKPQFCYDNVIKSLNQTYAAFRLSAISNKPRFSGAVNVSAALERANLGGILTTGELLNIASTLKTIRLVKEWRENSEIFENTELDSLFNSLLPNKFFEDRIYFCIKGEDLINDNASDTLYNIRRKIASATINIREKLDRIIRGQTSKYLQETIVTQRDGRFVVPVKSEHRSQFPGIVHDTSSSGATLFIEPMSVVETNNDIRVLMSKEKEEIERILSELSSLASDFSGSITESYKALVELSLIFAKASLAFKMKASVPIINTNGKILLKNARHPLLNPKTVVPISLALGDKYRTLVITGPNTGGKTVTLKVIGLLTLMTMCGLMIPCDDGTEISIFDNILVDIGDEQSIEQSLSTFSAHMVNIISIINRATASSLVLIDELGSGTDPIEGAALAKAILIMLSQKGAKTAATTHYAELKTYALDTEGVENASCEFDVTTLKPTYRLLLGIPGRSNAFAISEKLGLDKKIIENARSFISDDNRRFEKIIASLEQERQGVENERRELDDLKNELSLLKRKAENEIRDVEQQKKKILNKARIDAEHIIDSTRYRSNELINELEKIKKYAQEKNTGEDLRYAKNMSQRAIFSMQDSANPVDSIIKTDYKLPRELVVGDGVRLLDIGREGIVSEISDKNKKILISSGNLKIWTTKDNLELTAKSSSPAKKGSFKAPSKLERIASTEIDMRGFAVDEALIELDRFIDNALVTGINTVTIIHGKGTGTLRNAVHKFLRNHHSIKNFRVGLFGEGENGVTIAEISK